MNEQELIKYYNKFNEEKRLNTRHGQVEFLTSIKYINHYLKEFKNPNIIDIGAGAGKYSEYLANKGYDVTAVELIKHNVRKIQALNLNIKVIQANAIDLKKIKDESYDITLLFGPMYHLITKEEKMFDMIFGGVKSDKSKLKELLNEFQSKQKIKRKQR